MAGENLISPSSHQTIGYTNLFVWLPLKRISLQWVVLKRTRVACSGLVVIKVPCNTSEEASELPRGGIPLIPLRAIVLVGTLLRGRNNE